MKKLLALVALVAMVGVASVSAAPADEVTVTTTVTSTLEVNMNAGGTPCDTNAPSLSYDGTAADLLLQKDTTGCTYTTTSGVTWELDINDANDDTECNLGACPVTGSIPGSLYASKSNYIQGTVGTLTGGTAGNNFHATSADTHEDACASEAAGCKVTQSLVPMANAETPDSGEVWTFLFHVAVDDNPAQYADTYSDAWTVTISATT